MLSTHSFNALLKTLEEPPAHVKFLFATTDPQKLPITVISRCLQFTLRPLAVDEITHHLTDILAKESIQSEQDAIWQIAESAQGSLRDALSLTDQAIAYGQGAIHHQDVKEMLGLIDRTIIYDLILAIHQNQRERVSQLLLQFRQQALDVSLVLDQFISTLHELAMLQYLPDLSLKYSAEINKKIMTLSQLVSAQDIQLYYQIACKGRADLQLAVTQEQGFEMTVLRLLAFRPLQANEIVVSEPRTVQPASVTAQQIESHPVIEQGSEPETKPDIQEQHDSEQNHFVEHVDDHQVKTASTLSHIGHSPESMASVAEQLEHVAPISKSATPNTQELATSVNSANTEQVQDLSIGIEPETLSLQQTENIEAVNETQGLQDTDELALTSFGADFAENIVTTNTAATEEVFFLATEMDEEKPVAQLHEVVDVGTESITKTQPQNQVTVEIEQYKNHSQQTPQDILQLAPQQLEGEWDVNKWEYWFRNSDLSPAVQELAQHGLMIGMINGHSTFQISKQYENLLNQTQHALESSLKQQWSSTVFNVQYGEVESTTPFHMQNERKIRAYQRAEQMLHAEPVIKRLLQAFEGELQNIQLKV